MNENKKVIYCCGKGLRFPTNKHIKFKCPHCETPYRFDHGVRKSDKSFFAPIVVVLLILGLGILILRPSHTTSSHIVENTGYIVENADTTSHELHLHAHAHLPHAHEKMNENPFANLRSLYPDNKEVLQFYGALGYTDNNSIEKYKDVYKTNHNFDPKIWAPSSHTFVPKPKIRFRFVLIP